MKYICPECKHSGECEWYQNKDKVDCEACQYKVFTPIQKKITFLRFVSLAIFAIGNIALRNQGANIWLSIIFLLLLLACWKSIEYTICQRANKKALSSESKTEE